MFTTPCFIRKNSEELRNNLKELGYKVCACSEFEDSIWLHCDDTKDYTFNVHGVGYISEEEFPGKNQQWFLDEFLKDTNAVDCGINEKLFLATAALRDNSNINQWFTIDRECMYNKEDDPQEEVYWYLCNVDDYRFSDGLYHDQGWHEWHKASVEELIEHFK